MKKIWAIVLLFFSAQSQKDERGDDHYLKPYIKIENNSCKESAQKSHDEKV